MKLLFCIKALSTPGGGAERVFVDVVNGLYERGHDVAVLTFEPVSAPSFYELDGRIPRLAYPQSGIRITQPKALSALRQIVLDYAPDVAIGFMPSCYVPLSAALTWSGVPVIASEHNVPARYRKQPLHWLSILASSRLVDRFTAVSAQMKQQYPVMVRNKMTVMPNPVSVAVGATANVLGSSSAQKQIIAVGRLHEQKDHLTLIRAFARIAADFPDWSVKILGDGNERDRLKREIALRSLEQRVSLAGTVSDIQAEYTAAHLYVIPSRYESLGLATIEALAHGLPAIGFADCPGTNEIILDGVNGVLVDPEDDRVAALADAMSLLMADPTRRLHLANTIGSDLSRNGLPSVLLEWENLLEDAAA
ncbi:glycosyltransferase family 4 protein [Rhizobium halophilum]|uniref:glycosyltransferase family 4 protein n=1 Tax=Rhizobium halophilum TaxID=2846852 RepID=UPI001EFCF5AE|nr:glycosyltransferase family 4 protein [Rhizobium halophilum]MCF6368150.1 glycosyltransferase family 4 protein [Rhizobium halophilum]